MLFRSRPCPKVKKFGEGAPLWGEFNGEVENLTPNFSPPNYLRATVRGGLGAGAGPLLKSEAQRPGPSNSGGENYFSKNFFRPKAAGQNRSEIFREYGESHLYLSNFYQSGRYRHFLVKVWIGTGCPGNWGSHGPPNLGQILDTFQMPPKNTGGGRGKFFS